MSGAEHRDVSGGVPPGEGPTDGLADGPAGEAAIDDAPAALARAINALDGPDAAGESASPRPNAEAPAADVSRAAIPATPRLVEITIAVRGPGALADALAELRARPDVLDARVRRLEPGHAVVATLVTG